MRLECGVADICALLSALLWQPYGIGQAIIFLPCGFFYLFSSSIFSRRRLGVYHTSTHGVARANLGCRSETCCTRLAENTGHKKIAKKSPFGHHRTTLSGYIFANKACIDSWKQILLSSNISSTCPPQYGELRPTSG